MIDYIYIYKRSKSCSTGLVFMSGWPYMELLVILTMEDLLASCYFKVYFVSFALKVIDNTFHNKYHGVLI